MNTDLSFSGLTKRELCRHLPARKCCAQAELYGALLLAHTFSAGEVRIITGHEAFAHRLPLLMDRVMGFAFDRVLSAGKSVLLIREPEKLGRLWDRFGTSSDVALHVNRAIMEEECCAAAFLRGMFLTGGSVTEPSKRYHLEIVTTHLALTREIVSLMMEMQLHPKQTVRGGRHVLYFKASEAIEDVLTLMGAAGASIRLMQTKVEKDFRNDINRKVNCDTANVEKTVGAAIRQVEALNQLRTMPVWDSLSDSLRQTALLRLQYPEQSLSELAERQNISRSGIRHRLRKLMNLAQEGSL